MQAEAYTIITSDLRANFTPRYVLLCEKNKGVMDMYFLWRIYFSLNIITTWANKKKSDIKARTWNQWTFGIPVGRIKCERWKGRILRQLGCIKFFRYCHLAYLKRLWKKEASNFHVQGILSKASIVNSDVFGSLFKCLQILLMHLVRIYAFNNIHIK